MADLLSSNKRLRWLAAYLTRGWLSRHYDADDALQDTALYLWRRQNADPRLATWILRRRVWHAVRKATPWKHTYEFNDDDRSDLRTPDAEAIFHEELGIMRPPRPKKITARMFVTAWTASATLDEFTVKTGMKKKTARERAAQLRRKGVDLKRFNRWENTNDVDELNRLIREAEKGD